MSAELFATADWRALQRDLSKPLVLLELQLLEFRERVLALERTGHLVIEAMPDRIVVRGQLIVGCPTWVVERRTAPA